MNKEQLFEKITENKDKLTELGYQIPENKDELNKDELQEMVDLIELDDDQSDSDKAKPDESKTASGARVVNDKRNGKVSVAGNELAPGESLQLTAEQKKDERLMAKIKHGHKNELWTFAE